MSSIEDLDVEKSPLPSSLDIHPLKLFDIAKAEGRPLYGAAPMVRYSKLAFRETVAHYGTDLAWTPMILAKEFNRSNFARNSDLTISPTAPPTIAQFGASSPLELARATTLVAPFVNGVDLNCGCPQSWACAETMGAALMQKRELVVSMVRSAKEALREIGYAGDKTVSVKIRIHRDLRETVDFVRAVEEAGADFVTVHGRQRATRSSQPVDLQAIKMLKGHAHVPMIANGDVFSLADAFATAQETGVDGVLAARGLLQNPALFQGYERCPWEAVEVFMSKVVKMPIPFKLVVHHLTEMCGSDRAGGVGGGGPGTLLNKEERMKLVACGSMLELVDFLDGVREVRRFE